VEEGWVSVLTEIKVTGVGLGHCTATNNSDWRGDGKGYCHKQKSDVGSWVSTGGP